MLTSVISLLAFAAVSSASLKRQNNLEEFIVDERFIAVQGVLQNIGGNNSTLAEGADPGIVVASPSTVNPNYFYTWTRDSALTYSMLIDEYIFGNDSLLDTINDYVTSQAELQTVDNPSGSLWPAGDGLGEPKFYTNKTRFDSTWGRPQRVCITPTAKR
jgi:glucoamylase